MAKNKTTENELSVENYIGEITDEQRRTDIGELLKLFSEITGLPAKMWGTAIIGWGSYHYRYASGHEGDAPIVGLSSRANAITLYLESEFEGRDQMLGKLGKHKTSKACLYIKKLADIDPLTLREMIAASVQQTNTRTRLGC